MNTYVPKNSKASRDYVIGTSGIVIQLPLANSQGPVMVRDVLHITVASFSLALHAQGSLFFVFFFFKLDILCVCFAIICLPLDKQLYCEDKCVPL